MINESVFFWTFVSIAVFELFEAAKKKTGLAILNPLLMTIIVSVILILVTKTDTAVYKEKVFLIEYMLTPATVCLAVPLYEKINELKKNAVAIITGILSGVFSSAICILLTALIFKLDREIYLSFLPKSITTAIAIGVTEEIGGIQALTVIMIVVTGVLGGIIAEGICKIFKITHPVAKGAAIGTASHVGGTSAAIRMGETEGAVSGLSIAVAGLITVVVLPFFAKLI